MKCIYDYAYGIMKYPLGVIFLIDFFLTWKQTEMQLRGDFATNISSGLAKVSGLIGMFIGLLLSIFKRRYTKL